MRRCGCCCAPLPSTIFREGLTLLVPLSLENMLVTIPSPRAVSRTNYMSDIWIVGEGYATHSNARGGLTTGVYDGQWDANPEALVRRLPL